jgi:hypothetical protein
MPKVKIVGNMTEWHSPMAIKLHMASEPPPMMAISTKMSAPALTAASMRSGATQRSSVVPAELKACTRFKRLDAVCGGPITVT